MDYIKISQLQKDVNALRITRKLLKEKSTVPTQKKQTYSDRVDNFFYCLHIESAALMQKRINEKIKELEDDIAYLKNNAYEPAR